MIEQLINTGFYRFTGTIKDLKRFLGGLKITEVITDGEIQGINIFSAFAEFRYHGQHHKIAISSDFSNNNILNLEYRGAKKKC